MPNIGCLNATKNLFVYLICLMYRDLQMKPGESAIDKLDAVEDTKGNNGERGKLASK